MAWRTWSLARYGSAWLKSKCSNSRPGTVTLVVFGTWAALWVIAVFTVAGGPGPRSARHHRRRLGGHVRGRPGLPGCRTAVRPGLHLDRERGAVPDCRAGVE